MDIIFDNVAGLDVHQKTIMVCVRKIQPQGGTLEEVRTFGTMTRDLLELSDWLASEDVTHVAMESTGVLWKPVWNILEGPFHLLLVNPRELKQALKIDGEWRGQDAASTGATGAHAAAEAAPVLMPASITGRR